MGSRRWALLPLVLVTAVTVAVYALRIEEVRVSGLRSLPSRDVVSASGLRPGDRILWVRLSAAERRIERIPAVADAIAERALPDAVVIHVRERVPLARLDGIRELAVDSSGVIFHGRDEPVPVVLYGWTGAKRQGTRVDERSRRVLEALPRFPAVIRERARKLKLKGSFVLTLAGGTEIRFGSLNHLEAKADAAQAVLDAERGHRLEYIDVRSPSVPVSKRHEPPSPTPGSDGGAPARTPPGQSPAPATPAPPRGRQP
jgi:cell division protein FtsQ